jgi:large subunit ribosomal protein L35Ae
MKGVVLGYQRGKFTSYPKRVIIKVFGVTDKKLAARLVGKQVLWTSPKGEKVLGKIIRTHGNKGHVVAVFRKNLPGQAIFSEVEIR